MENISKLLAPILVFYCILSGIMNGSAVAILVTLFAVTLLIYFKNQVPPKENVDAVLGSSGVQVIAHRGGAFDAPENTLESIRVAHENGADAVELDLEFTSDGVAILMHDDTVDRTTNGTGPVKSYTFEQMRSLDASAKHPSREKFAGAQVPTLEEAVKLSLELGLKIYLDVKGNAEQAVPAILEMYKKYPAMYKNAIVCSFWPQISYMVRRHDASVISGLTYRSRFLTHTSQYTPLPLPMHKQFLYPLVDIVLQWSMHSWLNYVVGNSAVLLFEKDISKQTVDYFAARGVRVIVWTPNTAHDKAYFANTLGISYITDTLTNSHQV